MSLEIGETREGELVVVVRIRARSGTRAAVDDTTTRIGTPALQAAATPWKLFK